MAPKCPDQDLVSHGHIMGLPTVKDQNSIYTRTCPGTKDGHISLKVQVYCLRYYWLAAGHLVYVLIAGIRLTTYALGLQNDLP